MFLWNFSSRWGLHLCALWISSYCLLGGAGKCSLRDSSVLIPIAGLGSLLGCESLWEFLGLLASRHVIEYLLGKKLIFLDKILKKWHIWTRLIYSEELMTVCLLDSRGGSFLCKITDNLACTSSTFKQLPQHRSLVSWITHPLTKCLPVCRKSYTRWSLIWFAIFQCYISPTWRGNIPVTEHAFV